jgi:MerR HTH family regulatory protein
MDQAYPAGPDGGPIAVAGLADHHLRMVDTDHQSPDRSGGKGGDGPIRAAANFDDTLGRLDVEKLHRPPPLHDPDQQPLPDAHQQSSALQVPLKPMPASENTRASSVTPTLLSIGELSERTGVPTAAPRYYDELGLVRPVARAAGRRRYAASAIRDVSVILFFREIGFSLAEVGRFIAGDRQSQRDMIDHKMAELA